MTRPLRLLFASIFLLGFCFHSLPAQTSVPGALGALPLAAPLKLSNGLQIQVVPNSALSSVRLTLAVRAESDALSPQGIARWVVEGLAYGSDSLGALNLPKEQELRAKILEQSSKVLGLNDEKLAEAARKRINNLQRDASGSVLPYEVAQMFAEIGSHFPVASYSAHGVQLKSAVPAERLSAWLELMAQLLNKPAFRCSDYQMDGMYLQHKAAAQQLGVYWADSCRAALLGPTREGLRSFRLSDPNALVPPLSAMNFWHERNLGPENLLLIVEGPVDEQKVLDICNKYWGKLTKRSKPPEASSASPSLKLSKLPKKINCGFVSSEVLFLPLPADTSILRGWVPAIQFSLMNPYGTGIFDDLRLDGLIDTLETEIVRYRDKEWLLIRFVVPPNGKLNKKFRKAVHLLLNTLLEDTSLLNPDKAQRSAIRSTQQMLLKNLDLKHSSWANLWQTGQWPAKQINPKTISIAKKGYSDSLQKEIQVLWDIKSRKWLTLKAETKRKPIPWQSPQAQVARDSLSAWAQEFHLRWPQAKQIDSISFTNGFSQQELGLRQRLHHKLSSDSSFFELSIQYQLGTYRLLSLPIICGFLNEVGTYKLKAEELRDSLAILGCRYRFTTVEDRFILKLWGEPRGLNRSLALVSELIAYPDRDYSTLDRVISRETERRSRQSQSSEALGKALTQYLAHKTYSPYVRRMSSEEMRTLLEPARMRDSIRRLIQLPVQVHYYGPQPLDVVHKALMHRYKLPKRSRRLRRPFVKRIAYYPKPQILFYNLPNATDAFIGAYVPGNKLPLDSLAIAAALSQQLGDSPQSQLMRDLYTRRRISYATHGGIYPRELPGFRGLFLAEALVTHEGLEDAVRSIRSLARKPNIDSETLRKDLRRLAASTVYHLPDGDRLTQWVDSLRSVRCELDPRPAFYDSLMPLNANNLEGFFDSHIKRRPISYAVVADKKKVDLEKLGRYGEVIFVELDEFWKP